MPDPTDRSRVFKSVAGSPIHAKLGKPVQPSRGLRPNRRHPEVTKMISVFGAPIDDADAKTIVDYLTKNYGTGGPS